jgi:hypothetical protein
LVFLALAILLLVSELFAVDFQYVLYV